MTYDYLCTSCGHSWEAEQRISEDPLKQCPVCREMSAKRQVSGGAGFILKGGGWYSDLYGSPKATKSSEKSAESSSTCAAGACGTAACPAASTSASS